MFNKALLALMFFLCAPNSSRADRQHVHVPHNMVLFGLKEVFASHIVYKKPHNYQVILSLNIHVDDLTKYREAKARHPNNLFILLLDPMQIQDIAAAETISGRVFYVDEVGQNQTVIANLNITNENFKVIYFNEVPLSLDGRNP